MEKENQIAELLIGAEHCEDRILMTLYGPSTVPAGPKMVFVLAGVHLDHRS